MSNIQVMSSCLVGIASNTSSMSRMELTPWDLQLLLLDPIQRGILFHKQEIHENLIHHLKNSLSRTLDFFPPLCGRIGITENDDNTVFYFIDCNNEGVEFTHAVAHGVSVSDILEPKYKPEIVFSLFPLNGVSNCEGVLKPLVGVQVTELVDGLFISCTANHAIVDGTSFWHFFSSWSEISRGCDSISRTPVFERWFPSSVSKEDRLVRLPPLEQTDQSQTFVPPPLLERVFNFSKESLAKLKFRANDEAGTDKISTFQALCAHLWRATTRCRSSFRDDQSRQEGRFLMMAIGARARIPLPDGYFGNAINPTAVAANEAELLEKGLGYAAMKINEVVALQTTEAVLIKSVEDWVKNPRIISRSSLAIFGAGIVMMGSSPRFKVYGNDFGWGKPIAARSGKAQKFDGFMVAYPAAEAGGIDIELCLAPATLEAMENDAEFMEVLNF